MKINDTFLIFGRSPYLSTIKDEISRLIDKYHTCGINHPLNAYEFLCFGDSQTINKDTMQGYKLIVPSYLEDNLKTFEANKDNFIIGSDWVLKPDYISNNEYPLSLFYGLEYAKNKGFKRAILIASELKNFNKTPTQIQEFNELIKTFDIEIFQTNSDSNLDLPFIRIEEL